VTTPTISNQVAITNTATFGLSKLKNKMYQVLESVSNDRDQGSTVGSIQSTYTVRSVPTQEFSIYFLGRYSPPFLPLVSNSSR